MKTERLNYWYILHRLVHQNLYSLIFFYRPRLRESSVLSDRSYFFKIYSKVPPSTWNRNCTFSSPGFIAFVERSKVMSHPQFSMNPFYSTPIYGLQYLYFVETFRYLQKQIFFFFFFVGSRRTRTSPYHTIPEINSRIPYLKIKISQR